jgi:hypothetical protein
MHGLRYEFAKWLYTHVGDLYKNIIVALEIFSLIDILL